MMCEETQNVRVCGPPKEVEPKISQLVERKRNYKRTSRIWKLGESKTDRPTNLKFRVFSHSSVLDTLNAPDAYAHGLTERNGCASTNYVAE